MVCEALLAYKINYTMNLSRHPSLQRSFRINEIQTRAYGETRLFSRQEVFVGFETGFCARTPLGRTNGVPRPDEVGGQYGSVLQALYLVRDQQSSRLHP